jgi:hypothetical protein
MGVIRGSFVAGDQLTDVDGDWKIEGIRAIRGEGLPAAAQVRRVEGVQFQSVGGAPWVLHGVRSNERYLERAERERLTPLQAGLGRLESRLAAFIPMQKSDAWWDLAQDERRRVFQSKSQHIEIGAAYLPAIARRLYHCRDLGGPFDFLTWFEFAEADAGAFDELVGRLRETEEWKYVTREVEVRLRRH